MEFIIGKFSMNKGALTWCSRTMGDRSRKLSGLDLTCERGDGLAASDGK